MGTESLNTETLSPEEQPARESRERILHAAMRRFAQYGYAGTSLKGIAGDVGISTPALYWHFSSKEAIAYEAIKQGLEDFLAFVGDALKSAEPKARLSELVIAHVTWQLEQSEVATAYATTVGIGRLATDLAPEHTKHIQDRQRGYSHEVRNILIEGRRQGVFTFEDPVTAGFAILTVCEYVHTWFNPQDALTVAEVAQRYSRLALAMAGAQQEAE